MTTLNIYFYGKYKHYKVNKREKQDYWTDVISYNCQLKKNHFDRKHKYQLEWDVPDEEGGIWDGFWKTN